MTDPEVQYIVSSAPDAYIVYAVTKGADGAMHCKYVSEASSREAAESIKQMLEAGRG